MPVESLAVEVRLLGPLEVVDSTGRTVPIPGERLRALVALLALEAPRTVTTDRIIETFWGNEQVDRPELALQVAVSRLRKAAGSDLVVTEPGGYRFGLMKQVLDVERFRNHVRRGRQLLTMGQPGAATESFRQALAQWRGSALSDLRHLEFAEEEARLLEDERVAGVEFLLEAEIAAGNHATVIGELNGLIEAFPLREKLWSLQMLALYRSGRQADALRSFARVKRILAEELGVEPSQELVDLEESILLHDPLLDELSEPESDSWLSDRELVHFSTGEVIFEEGSPADNVYWIEEGRVEVVKVTAGGATEVLAQLGTGRYFGELAALLRTGRTATVRAIAPTTLSIHTVDELRRRLGAERSHEPEASISLETIRDLVRRGEYLRAFDAASELIERGDFDPELRYMAVLALARSGATSQARNRYESLELASVDRDGLSPRLAEDIDALAGRLDKDMALSESSKNREHWASRSASRYSKAFDRHGSAYLAVNSATMRLVAGDRPMAEESARAALAAIPTQAPPATEDDAYWLAATEAEAALILGDISRASEALALAAARSSGNHAARATTIRQLKVICSLLDLDPDILNQIANPVVVHYCGHRIAPLGQPGRFAASEEEQVRVALAAEFDRLGVGFGFGSLAAGADILAAEALLDRGSELQVHLPFARNDFVRTSVEPAGADWVTRFERCLARASGVVTAMVGEFGDDPVLFDYASRMAMGDALLRASILQTEAHQVAVWDGVKNSEPAGTAVDVENWRKTGHPASVIGVEGTGPPLDLSSPRSDRQVRTLVYGDFAGFSRLTDGEVFEFQQHVMNALARTIEGYRPHVLSGRTWGDGFYLVFDHVSAAADCALSLQETIGRLDPDKEYVGAIRGLRIAAHVTPVFDGWDSISGSRLFYGSGVTQVARIEPRTPEGEVYVTRPFAALAFLANEDKFACQYVGTVPVAKGYGSLPLFSLRRSARQPTI